jgi:hypothetical protein
MMTQRGCCSVDRSRDVLEYLMLNSGRADGLEEGPTSRDRITWPTINSDSVYLKGQEEGEGDLWADRLE